MDEFDIAEAISELTPDMRVWLGVILTQTESGIR